MSKAKKFGVVRRWLTAAAMGGSTLAVVPATSTGGCSAEEMGQFASGFARGFEMSSGQSIDGAASGLDPYASEYAEEEYCDCEADYAESWYW